jgi:hypothetical protein
MVCDLNVSPIVPSNRTLCPASPSLQWVARVALPHLTSQYRFPDYRYYDQLRLPNAHLGSLRSSLVHRYLAASICSCSPNNRGSQKSRKQLSCAWGVCSTGYPMILRFYYKETFGSPKFPGYPFEYMPRSQIPVVSDTLAIPDIGLLSSAACRASTFPRTFGVILSSTTIHISGFNSAACTLVSPSSVLPLPVLHVGFTTDPVAIL